MPKVSISLDRDTAEAIARQGRSLGEVVKEIVLEHARLKSRSRRARVIYKAVYDIIEELAKDDLDETRVYGVIGQFQALIKGAEAIGLTSSERIYIGDLWIMLRSVVENSKGKCRLEVARTLLIAVGLYLLSILYYGDGRVDASIPYIEGVKAGAGAGQA
jgi:hypothetical protein